MSTVQVSVSLTKSALERLERLRRKQHRSRSEIIARAVEAYIENKDTPPPLPTFDIEPMSPAEQRQAMIESMERRASKR